MEQNQKIYNLVAAAKTGDANAFTELYNLSYGMVYHTCFGSLRNQEDAEDAAQEVFIYVYTKLNDLTDNYAFFGWVKQIALHTSFNKVRARKDNASYDDAISNEEIIEGDDNLEMLPDTYVLRDEKRKIVMEIMATSLSEAQYQTLFMYYYSDLKIEQIANIMGVSEGTVKTRLKSAKVKVKAGIEAYENKTGDRLAVAGAIPSIAMVLKTTVSSVPMRLVAFKGIQGLVAGSGMGAGASAGVGAGSGASAGMGAGTGAGAQTQMPGNPVPSNVASKVANSATKVAAKGAAKGAVKGTAKAAAGAASKGIVTKVVAGIAAATILGAGTFGVVTLLNKKNDKPKTRTEKNSDADESSRGDLDPELLSTGLFPTSELKVGNVIQFGNYNGTPLEWIILETDGDRAFLMSKDIVSFSDSNYGTSTNAAQYVYTAGFTAEEKDYIELTTTIFDDYRKSNKLYLMSTSEVEKYKNVVDMTATANGQPTAWWTSTPGSEYNLNYAVDVDGTVSEMDFNAVIGIRPVMWINNNGYSEMGPDGLTVDMSLYEQFLNNEIKADATNLKGYFSYNKDYSNPSPDGYTLDELIAFAFEGTNNISYAYIDCGNDGAQELLIRRLSEIDSCEFEEYVLVTGVTGELEATYAYTCWNYRTTYDINKYGIYSYGGSGGASLHGGSTYALNRYGYPVLIEESWEEYTFSEVPGISSEFLSQALAISDGGDIDYLYIPGSVAHYFKFEDGEAYYNSYVYYGDDSSQEQSVRDLYTNYANNYMAPEDYEGAYSRRVEKLGLTSIMKGDASDTEIVWQTLK